VKIEEEFYKYDNTRLQVSPCEYSEIKMVDQPCEVMAEEAQEPANRWKLRVTVWLAGGGSRAIKATNGLLR
jgi:hypothetical protein